MATPDVTCCICARPILLGAHHLGERGEPAHARCAGAPGPVNGWPEGTRHLLCLRCEKPFESDSKARRLCRACGQVAA